jgi:hypothetical protein
MIDHEILSTIPLLWHIQKFHFLAKVYATSTGKLLYRLPRNDTVVELCSGEFNVGLWLTVVIRSEKYQHHHHHCKLRQ